MRVLTKEKESLILTGHTGYVQGVAWDPLGEMVVTQSADRTFKAHMVSRREKELEKERVGDGDGEGDEDGEGGGGGGGGGKGKESESEFERERGRERTERRNREYERDRLVMRGRKFGKEIVAVKESVSSMMTT